MAAGPAPGSESRRRRAGRLGRRRQDRRRGPPRRRGADLHGRRLSGLRPGRASLLQQQLRQSVPGVQHGVCLRAVRRSGTTLLLDQSDLCDLSVLSEWRDRPMHLRRRRGRGGLLPMRRSRPALLRQRGLCFRRHLLEQLRQPVLRRLRRSRAALLRRRRVRGQWMLLPRRLRGRRRGLQDPESRIRDLLGGELRLRTPRPAVLSDR